MKQSTLFLQKLFSLFLLFVCVSSYATSIVIPPRSQPIMIRSSQAKQPIQLQDVKVHTSIAGTIAKTQVDLVVYNPNNLQLEGELQFPLMANQSVSGFALDLNNEMRPAVAVEKSVGQQIFEDVTRQKVDPALLEKTSGNFYKIRIYPIPAQGTRTVRLNITQNLTIAEQNISNYQFPVMFAGKIGNLALQVDVYGEQIQKINAFLGVEKLKATQGKGKSTINLSRTNYQGNNLLTVELPNKTDTPVVTTQTLDGKTYFYAEVPSKNDTTIVRAAPKKLSVIWDASGSGVNRNHQKEFLALDNYFKSIKNTTVELTIVRNDAESTRTFPVRDGDWQALKNVLSSVVYDGATNPAAMVIPRGSDLALLFTDGVFNFGDAPFPETSIPMYTLSSSVGANADLLRLLAQKNGAEYIDLLGNSAEQVQSTLSKKQQTIKSIDANGATDLVYASQTVENGRYFIAGILSDPRAKVQIKLDNGETYNIQIDNGQDIQGDVAAQLWAQFKLKPLLADSYRYHAEIIRLGKQFNLVTPSTSLIVLDEISDYVKYEIVPPESLKKEYYSRLANQQSQKNNNQKNHLDRLYYQFNNKEKWWETSYPTTPKEVTKPKYSRRQEIEPRPSYDSNPEVYEDRIEAPAVEEAIVTEAMAPPSPMAGKSMAPSSASERSKGFSKNNNQRSGSASIQLKKWQPNEPYLKRMLAAKPEDLYAIYLDEKPAYENSTAFFLDVSDLMFDKKQNALALRVLSNLAEMNLENRHILRILGYRLLQAKQYKLAIPIFEKVKQLSPEEPQSYRDLGLAYNQIGQNQLAVNELWEVVSTPWHNRFPGVELIALAELNAIVETAPKKLDTSNMDSRFLRNLPLDLRAVLSWDADNTDIDLWVIDPDGEKAYYGHKLTRQGGRMSDDFTGGYGPEEFSLKKAKPGKYTIQAQFYGHNQQIVAPSTTLMLTLTTNFGKKKQKDEQVILRLSNQREVVTVGTFTVR